MKFKTIAFSAQRLELRSDWTHLNWLIPSLFVGFVSWMFNRVLSWEQTFQGAELFLELMGGTPPTSAESMRLFSTPFMVFPIFTLLIYNVVSLGLKEKQGFPKSLILTPNMIRYEMGREDQIEFETENLMACGFTTLASGKRADVYFFQFPQLTLCLPIDPHPDLDAALKTFYKLPDQLLPEKRSLKELRWELSRALTPQKQNLYYLSGLMTTFFTCGMLILLKSRELELSQSMDAPFYFVLAMGILLSVFNVWLARKKYPSREVTLTFPHAEKVNINHGQQLYQELELPKNALYCMLPELGYLGWCAAQANVEMPNAKGHATTYLPTHLKAHKMKNLYSEQLKPQNTSSKRP